MLYTDYAVGGSTPGDRATESLASYPVPISIPTSERKSEWK